MPEPKKFQDAIDILTVALNDALTKVVARKWIELSGNEEAKKQLQASEFMNSILTGKLNLGDVPIEATEDYKKADRLAVALNVLSKLQEAK